MMLDDLKKRREALGMSYRELSERASVPLGTVQKIFGGITRSPRRETLLRLQEALYQTEMRTGPEDSSPAAGVLRDPGVPYGTARKDDMRPGHYSRQGTYTIDDYYSLPDEQRVELIDGVFYDMSAPTSPHQLIGGDIYAQLLAYRNARKGKCLPMVAPVDVQLDRDNRTMVQPDVLILCDRSKLTLKGIFGAPDFVVEVLSPSTRKKDIGLKMHKYLDAGVREYWLIDPKKEVAVVYDLEHEAIPVIYSFTDPIPVGIWDGECKVDLSGTKELLEELFPELRKD